jgi:hypothetical protein
MIIQKSVSTIKKYKKNIDYRLWSISPEGRENFYRLKSFHNMMLDQRCFVLGNGPSLLKNDLTLLKNEITIGSNGIFLIFDKMGYKPTFLTVEDGLVAEDRAEELNKVSGTRKLFPKDLSQWLKRDEETTYCNFIRGFKTQPKFSKNFLQKSYWGGTVTYFNLQLAYYLGCKEIYMIGFDHNYKIKDKIEKKVIVSERLDENHFHPDYFGPGYRWHDPMVWRMELAYTVARKFFDEHNVKIYNATVGGNLEVFERKNFDKIFK